MPKKTTATKTKTPKQTRGRKPLLASDILKAKAQKKYPKSISVEVRTIAGVDRAEVLLPGGVRILFDDKA